MATADSSNTRLFVLALGLLVGFVIGFVMLLSRIPVDTSLADYHATEVAPVQQGASDFEFYTVLEDKEVAKVATASTAAVVRDVTNSQPVIKPATRVVPANAQNLNRNRLATESYAEIPASSLGQESYYLQAGNFIEQLAAERARAAVLLLGLEAFIVTRQDSNGQLGHRVRIGPFFDPDRLTNAKKRLRRANLPYDIIRVTG